MRYLSVAEYLWLAEQVTGDRGRGALEGGEDRSG